MTVTRRALLALDNACATLEALPAAPGFALWVTDVREVLAKPVADMRAKGKVPDDVAITYADYESARIVLMREYAAKDPNGQPLMDNAGVFILEDHVKADAALQELRQDDRWRAAYEAVVRQKREWTEWMDAAAPDDLVASIPTLAVEGLPETITAELLKPLKPFLHRPTTGA